MDYRPLQALKLVGARMKTGSVRRATLLILLAGRRGSHHWLSTADSGNDLAPDVRFQYVEALTLCISDPVEAESALHDNFDGHCDIVALDSLPAFAEEVRCTGFAGEMDSTDLEGWIGPGSCSVDMVASMHS